ncbi:MAG: hypothetical protein AAF384_07265 [Pseudomonadota bacterium]
MRKLAPTALLLILSATSFGAAAMFEFTFSGECDDCVGTLGDGLSQSVTGTLTLSDITTNGSGFIEIDSGNFESFSYSGSNLINPFSFDDAFTITGLIAPDGVVQAGGAVRLETSDGTNGPFDFGDFCTALGQSVLGPACFGVGIVEFEVDSAGEWSISAGQAFDEGFGGQFHPVPLPLSLPLLLSGMAGVSLLGNRRG